MKRPLARLLNLMAITIASVFGVLNMTWAAVHPVIANMNPPQLSHHPKLLGYELLIQAAQGSCPSQDRIEQLVSATSPVPNADEPIEMFLLPPLVRFIYQFPQCLSNEQLGSIKDHLTSSRQRLFGHGTINHAALRATSWYLLAQKFPEATWTDWDGTKHSSADVMRTLKSKMIARTNGFYQQGHYELFSPTYSLVNLYPYLNLVEFAIDSQVKKLADAQANLEVAALLTNSFHGEILPPLTRKNYDQRNASNPREKYSPSVGQSILKYYSGEPSGLSDADWWGRGEPPFVVMLELSRWRPIFPVELFSSAKAKGLRVHIDTPGFSEWGAPSDVELSGDSYISDYYSLSAGNGEFKVDQYYEHIQTSAVTIKSDGEFNQIECYHPYFSNASDGPTWGTDRWSPTIQSALLSDRTLALVGQIPSKDPWPGSPTNPHSHGRWRPDGKLSHTVYCRIPADMAVTQTSSNNLLISSNYATVKLTSLAGELELTNPTTTHRVFKVDGPLIALVFSVRPNANLGMKAFEDDRYEFNPDQIRISDSHGAFIQFMTPSMMPTKYIRSYPKTSALAPVAPIQSQIVSLKLGALTISDNNGTPHYRCQPDGCINLGKASGH